MWAELGHSLGFVFSIQSSVYGAITVTKVSLFSTWIWSTVSVYSTYVSVEIDPFGCEQTSVI